MQLIDTKPPHSAEQSTWDTELVELLLARKALVTDDHDEPLVFRASRSQIVTMLLAHSPQLLDARSKRFGTNALHYATDPEIVQQLLSLKPALLEESDREGASPLDMAVAHNRDKVVAQMLAQCPGADVFREGSHAIPSLGAMSQCWGCCLRTDLN